MTQCDAFIQHNADIAMKFVEQLSNRLRHLGKGFTQLALNDASEGEEAADLFAIGQYYDKQEQFDRANYAYKQYLKYCPEGEHIDKAKKRMEETDIYALTFPFVSLKNRRIYSSDTIIYAQGEEGEELYVIQSGSVRIVKIVNNSEVILNILRAGDVLGEMAIIESKPRSVTAITHEASIIIAISKKNFDYVLATNPHIIGLLVRSFAERIWFLYKYIHNATLVDPIARVYDTLLIQLERRGVSVSSDDEYTFDFGFQDLINMMGGLVEGGSEKILQKLSDNTNINISDDKIHIDSISAISKECDYYKSIERRKRAFKELEETMVYL
jgi:CRP-like cAMP-binding protein